MISSISKTLLFFLISLFGIKIAGINIMLAILVSATLITIAFRLLILPDTNKYNNKIFKNPITLAILLVLSLIVTFLLYKNTKEIKEEISEVNSEQQLPEKENKNNEEIREDEDKSFNQIENNEENFKEALLKEVISDNEIVVEVDGNKENIKLLGLNVDGENRAFAKNYIADNFIDKNIFLEIDPNKKDEENQKQRYVWIEKPENLENPGNEEITTKQLNGILLFNGYNELVEDESLKYYNIFKELNDKAKEEFKGIYEVKPEEKNEDEKANEENDEKKRNEEALREEENNEVDDVSFYDGFSIEDTTKDGQADGRFAIIRIDSSMIDDNKLQEFYQNFVMQKDFKYVVVLFTDYTEPSGIYATKEEVLRNVAFNVDANGNYNPIDTEEKIVYKKDENNKLIKQE